MNFNQLRIFYYAAKYGSLSAAAEALYITQPAVTKQIQKMQETYSIKLFSRFGKKIVLTDAGHALYNIAGKIFLIEKQAEEIIRDFQQQKIGHIRIHTSESFGAYYLPAIIIPFSKKHPQIRLSVTILPIPQVVEAAVKFDNDLGFISYPVEHKKLVVKEILQDRLVLIASPSHPFARKQLVEPRDLEKEPFVMAEPESATREIADGFFKKHGLSVSFALELSSNEAIKKAVEQGIGLSLVSQNVAREEIRWGTLKVISLADPSLTRRFYMIRHKDKYLSKLLQILIGMVERGEQGYSEE